MLRPDDFDYVAALLKERSGLIITRDKAYLLESRLMPLARARALKGLEELIAAMRGTRDESLLRDVTEAMTTNESFFFRDIKPFDQFRDIVLPQLLEARATRKSLRIWSAASSSGQEPYSIAMILKEMSARLTGWKIEIVGTDISQEMLEKAKAGLYSQFEVQRGLPIQLLVKYFKKKDEMWQVDPALRAMVQFKEFNLLHDLKVLGQFDIVFCRNVLIYFDQPTKARVLENMAKLMPDDGVLYLGGAETVLGVTEAFKPIQNQRGIYAVNRGGAAAAPAPMPSLAVPPRPTFTAPPAAPTTTPAATPPRPAFGTPPATPPAMPPRPTFGTTTPTPTANAPARPFGTTPPSTPAATPQPAPRPVSPAAPPPLNPFPRKPGS